MILSSKSVCQKRPRLSVFYFLCLSTVFQPVFSQKADQAKEILTGAAQTAVYFPELRGKTLALVVNPGSRINQTHLVDSLLNAGMKVRKIFAPEHGFRGNADAGEEVANSEDPATHLPVISLYGKHTRPSAGDLKDIDLVVFDLQDVGARFYTYLSTLNEVMRGCAEQKVPLLLLDRPNPNGGYVDGPVLDTANSKSFVGMHPVPIVYGMTIGEYAQMINTEGWLGTHVTCNLHVVQLKNYTHKSLYHLPLPPSPNLPNDQSIALYPSLCLFEGTVISLGRGTPDPFQILGHPLLKDEPYIFTPVSIQGKSKHPPLENQECHGIDLRFYPVQDFAISGKLNLNWLLDFYRKFPDKPHFFNAFFERLSGNKELRKQIEAGLSEKQIRKTWEPGLSRFRQIRKKYLFYAD